MDEEFDFFIDHEAGFECDPYDVEAYHAEAVLAYWDQGGRAPVIILLRLRLDFPEILGQALTMKNSRRSNGHQRKVMEIRRSSAAQPHKNKSKYSRKNKHKSLTFSD